LNSSPSLTGVDPSVLKPGGNSEIRVIGTQLDAISQLQLVAPNTAPITATRVTSNSGLVQATIAIPPDAAAAPWDIVVSDPQGRAVRLPQSVRIERSQSATETPAQLLDRYLNADDLTPDKRTERLRSVQQAAQAEGLGDITVASFIRDTSPEAQQQQDRLARRLGLAS
jgi:hypothetical protein